MGDNLSESDVGKTARNIFKTFIEQSNTKDPEARALAKQNYNDQLASLQKGNPTSYQKLVDLSNANRETLRNSFTNDMAKYGRDPISIEGNKTIMNNIQVPLGYNNHAFKGNVYGLTDTESNNPDGGMTRYYPGGIARQPDGAPMVGRHEGQHGFKNDIGDQHNVYALDRLYGQATGTKFAGRESRVLDPGEMGRFMGYAKSILNDQNRPMDSFKHLQPIEKYSAEDVRNLTATQQLDMLSNAPLYERLIGGGYKTDHPDVGWFDESVNAVKGLFNGK